MLGCVCKIFWVPGKAEGGRSCPLAEVLQSRMPRAMFRNISPKLYKPLYKRPYGRKSDVILSITPVTKWVLIYMPDPNRNQVRAIWTKSVQALNEKLKAPRNSFLHLLRFCFHQTQWPGMIFEHVFCDMCLCDHSPMRKHIGLVLFRRYRRLEEKWSGARREGGSACLKNGSPRRGARAQESLPSQGRGGGWVNAQKRALKR